MLARFTRFTRLGAVIPCAALLLAGCDSRAGRAESGSGSNAAPASGASGFSLGSAGTYGVLAGSTVTCAGPDGSVGADLGLWPGSAVTGFPTCSISGSRNMANAVAQAAQSDLTAVFNALAGTACGTTLTADLGGRTLAPGVYCSTSSQGLTGTVTFDAQGNGNATFVIQVASALTVAGAVDLIGGAQAKNVWWQVGSSATIGAGSAMKGNIVAFTAITLNDNAILVGRALARNGGVTMGSNNRIILP